MQELTESFMKILYLHNFKEPLCKILSVAEGKKSNFTMAKPGRYHLNQAMKVNSISNRTN